MRADVDGSAARTGATVVHPPLSVIDNERPAQTIRVAAGDNLQSLAASFHADPGAMRWANGLVDQSQPRADTPLLMPPGPGALVQARPGELPSHLADRLGLDPRVILDYNSLHSDSPLPQNTWIQVPQAAAPAGSVPSSAVVPLPTGVPGVSAAQLSHGINPRFPWGQCTYYVSSRRNVPWDGDAWSWYSRARAYGRPEGKVPVQGAILVMWGSWYGHVAYVERVNPDGSFVVSEMNVKGVGVRDERTMTLKDIPLIGFIY
ncbi:MAG TPA: CHAP domain-containing protein [Candidatus Dormibacteraeota bacterium]|nr:CHAP domain-containing protein [Candidatus Dormibacteraeota bacterium]